MTILADYRQPLIDALDTLPATTYTFVPEAPIVPFIAYVPSIPYMEPTVISNSTVRMKLNAVLTVGVEIFDNASSLDNIEQLIIGILGVLPSGWVVEEVSQPAPMTLNGGSTCIAAEIAINTQITQTTGD